MKKHLRTIIETINYPKTKSVFANHTFVISLLNRERPVGHLLVFLFFLGSVIHCWGQTTYYSTASGSVATLTNWNSASDGSGFAPGSFGTNNTWIIQNGFSMTLTGTTTWNIGTPSGIVTIQSGGTWTNSSSGTVTLGVFNIYGGGIYINNTGSASATVGFPGTTKNWADATNGGNGNGTVEIQNQGTSNVPASIIWGNVRINATLTQAVGNSGNYADVRGNFTVDQTGSFEYRLMAGQTASHRIRGNLTINGGSLNCKSGTGAAIVQVDGNVNVSGGTFNFTSSAAVTLYVLGNFNFSSGTLTNPSANCDLKFEGNISLTNPAGWNTTAINLETSGTADQTISGNGYSLAIRNLGDNNLYPKTGKLTLTSGTNMTINNSIIMNNTGSANQFVDGGNTLTALNNVSMGGDANGYNLTGTIQMNNTGNAAFRDFAGTDAIVAALNNVGINPTGTFTTNFNTLSGGAAKTITIKGNLTVGNTGTGAITLCTNAPVTGNHTFNIGGNFTNNRTTSITKNASAVMTFNGASNQTITSSVTSTGEAFQDFTINKSSGSTVLANNISIAATKTLNVTNGILDIGINTVTINGTNAVAVAAGGTLQGSGTVAGTISLTGTISPGASPGTINTGPFTFNDFSTYKFEISNATGVAGTDWDKIVSTGAINVTGSSFLIDLTSINIINFVSSTPYTWLIASGTSIIGFNTNNFYVDTTNFAPLLSGGSFTVTQTGNDIYLVFSPIAGPVVDSPTVTDITNTSAILGAEITSDGGSTISARGTVYKTSAGVTIADNPLVEGGTTTGVFTHTRSGLSPETPYHFAGYATNSTSTTLSPESDFITLSNPPSSEASEFGAIAISSSQIDLRWTVASFPGSGASASGYIILRREDSTDPGTTGIENANAPGSLSLPSGTILLTIINSGSTNNFSNLSLAPSSQYNYLIVPFTWDGVNAATFNYYLANSPSSNATTQAGLPVVTTPTVSAISATTADLGANVTLDGGNTLTARGTVYKSSAGVTITDNPLAEGGTTTGVFSHTRSTLSPETQYFFKGYATNANGSGLSSEDNFYTYSAPPTSEVTGFSGVPFSNSQINLSWTTATFPGMGATATGYVILRRSDSNNPSTSGFVNGADPASLSFPGGTTLVTTVTSGATSSYNDTGLGSPNTQYNYLILPFTWDNVHALTYNYYLTNAATTFATTLPAAPLVNTPTATAITENSAILGATVTSNNGSALTERGTVYKTSSPVTASDNPLAEGGLLVSTYSHTRNSLSPQTQYFYAGYATNIGGVGLSSEDNFRTLSNPPVSEATNLTATPVPFSQIDLSWTIAAFPGSGATASGYIILRKNGSNPSTTGIVNATAPGSLSLPVGTTLVTTIISGATNSYSNMGLVAGIQYNYLIIPFTWDDMNPTTYNYYLTNGATASGMIPAPNQTFAADGSAFSLSKWSAPSGTVCDNTNQTNLFTNGGIAYFCTTNGTGIGASITVSGITANENFSLTSAGGTISNQNNGIVTIDVANGKTLDLNTQSLSGSSTAGYIKNNAGILATAGNTYQGGFTMNAGTIIVRGVNAMGSGVGNTLTLNGGIVASNANRDLSAKYGGGITIGGNIQFGDVGGLASTTANLTFSNSVSLGSATRTFTKGHTGNVIFSGVISGSNGITYSANSNATSGVFTISNAANTYTGTTTINGGEVEFSGGDGSLGAVPGVVTPNSIVIDGGRLTVNTTVTTTLNANRGIQVGATAGTGISVKTGGTLLVYNGIITDKPSTIGSWAKQGGNTLQLGGINTYSGSTAINNGVLQLINGSNRLPTGTVLIMGQAASSNLGIFDMNGFSQQIAGLNSTPGSNGTAGNNTILSAGAVTLTISGSGNYSYGDGSNSNSGILTGTISLIKNGTGMQTLGDANTYTGSTTITNGELRFTPSVNTNLSGSLIMNGGTLGTIGIAATRTLTFSSFDLLDNSKIDLSIASDHTITFTAAGTFTGGKTLTIYGWQGTGGTSGTKGKLFFGSTSSGLSVGQLAQVQFNDGTIASPGTNYPAAILPTGEIVSPTTLPLNIAPTIVMNVSTTSNYMDGGAVSSPASPYAVSGVIGDPTDPFNTLGIDFTIADTETAVGSLTVTATSSVISVVPNANINITGSGASRNVKINPAAVGYSTITVSVNDGVNTTSFIINYAASAASVNPGTTRFLTGTSDASTGESIDANYMLVGDDENQVLRLYNRQNSGLPVNGFDYSTSLGISMTNPEVDIEGSVEVGNRIYWLGSHSNSANSGALRPNRYRLFATDVSGSGAATTLSYVGRYDGLRSDLLSWDAGNGHGLGANYFGLTASATAGIIPEIGDGSGFNIEGLTIAPDNTTAYLCFRAPISPASDRTKALIVPVTNLTSLVTGNPSAGPATFGTPILLDLGGRGIREIMRNASGQYIIMAGPHDGGNDFKLYTWTGNAGDVPEPRAADLTALQAGGSIECILNVPDPLLSTSTIQVLVDNGDTQFYGDGIIAKELPNVNHKKFRSEEVELGCVTKVFNISDAGTNSLRDAIACVPPGSTITFDASLIGLTITLTSGEILIDKDITIVGPGLPLDITLSGNSASRIFHVTPGNTLNLKNLSLKNANATSPNGGALFIEGNLALESMLLQNNFEDGVTPKGITINSMGGLITIIGPNVQIKQ